VVQLLLQLAGVGAGVGVTVGVGVAVGVGVTQAQLVCEVQEGFRHALPLPVSKQIIPD